MSRSAKAFSTVRLFFSSSAAFFASAYNGNQMQLIHGSRVSQRNKKIQLLIQAVIITFSSLLLSVLGLFLRLLSFQFYIWAAIAYIYMCIYTYIYILWQLTSKTIVMNSQVKQFSLQQDLLSSCFLTGSNSSFCFSNSARRAWNNRIFAINQHNLTNHTRITIITLYLTFRPAQKWYRDD